MPDPVTAVQACNRALSLFGHPQQITGFSDGSPEADAATLWYGATIESFLGTYQWNWARRTVELALSSEVPEIGPFTNYYLLPADYIVAVKVGTETFPYLIERTPDGHLAVAVCFSTGLRLEYVAAIEISLFDPKMCMSFYYLLAANLASALKADMATQKRMLELHEVELKKAGMRNDFEQKRKEAPFSPANNSRYPRYVNFFPPR